MKGRFLPFLVSLVLLFVLYPVMLEFGYARLFRLAFMVVLATAVYSLGRTKRTLAVALLLGVPALATQSLAYWAPGQATLVAATVATMLFLGFVVVVMLATVLGAGEVTADRIAGAISVFLLLGLLWTTAYSLVALADPESFRGLGLGEGLAEGQEYGFIYYSFVTLTTLGYGDIGPLSDHARSLAIAEAVIGQLYLVVLVASLVGMYLADRRPGQAPK